MELGPRRSAIRAEGIRPQAANTEHARGTEMTDLHRDHAHHGHHHAGHEGRATVKDPVCGMMVDPDRTEHHADYKGETFHFCSARCRDKFVAAPEQYLKPEAKLAAPEHPSPQKGVIYTCP